MKTKSLITILLTLSFISFTAFDNVPNNIKSDFEKRYKKAENVEWNQNKNKIMVNFDHNGWNKEAIYSRDGQWEYTSASIAENDLPDCIVEVLSQEYDLESIQSVTFYESPSITANYDITMKLIAYAEEDEKLWEEESDEEEIATETLEYYLKLTFNDECELIGEEEVPAP